MEEVKYMFNTVDDSIKLAYVGGRVYVQPAPVDGALGWIIDYLAVVYGAEKREILCNVRFKDPGVQELRRVGASQTLQSEETDEHAQRLGPGAAAGDQRGGVAPQTHPRDHPKVPRESRGPGEQKGLEAVGEKPICSH